MKGYEDSETALHAGSILQEILKQESVMAQLLDATCIVNPKKDVIFKVMKLIENPEFAVSTDAFSTLQILTTQHKSMMAGWLQTNYDLFFTAFNCLINSKNDFTRHQSLRLLHEILTEPENFGVMMKYIADRENLKLMMQMLKDKSQAIQFEAFHVFKVFVANPQQTYPVKVVLWNNQKKLTKVLENFEQQLEDKELVLDRLSAMTRPTDPVATEFLTSTDLSITSLRPSDSFP